MVVEAEVRWVTVKARTWNWKTGKTYLLTGSLLSLLQEPFFWYATEYLQVLFSVNDLKNMKVHVTIYISFSTLKLEQKRI